MLRLSVIRSMNSKFDLRSGSIFRSLGKSNSGISRRKRKCNVATARIGSDPVHRIYFIRISRLKFAKF